MSKTPVLFSYEFHPLPSLNPTVFIPLAFITVTLPPHWAPVPRLMQDGAT